MPSKWPLLEDREWFQARLDEKLTYKEIAALVGGGCTWYAARRWARKLGLRSRLGGGSGREPKAYWPGH